MCLAVPGKIIAIREEEPNSPTGTIGTVDFQGSRVDVGLGFTPEAKVGDWVLVRAGFALNVLAEEDAIETWKYLQLDGVNEVPSESVTDNDQ